MRKRKIKFFRITVPLFQSIRKEVDACANQTTNTMQHSWLRSFHYTAKLGRISKAAECLNISESSISTQIKQLEEFYQTPLFSRPGRQLELTERGKSLLDYTIQYFDQEARIRAYLERERDGITKLLRLGSEHPAMIATLTRKTFPTNSDIDIQLYGRSRAKLLEWFQDGEIDMVLCHNIRDHDIPAHGIRIPLGVDEVWIISGREYTPREGMDVGAADLRSLISNHSWIVPQLGYATRDLFDDLCTKFDVAPASRISTASYAGVVEAVHADMGLGMLIVSGARQNISGLRAGDFTQLQYLREPGFDEMFAFERSAVIHEKTRRHKGMSALIDQLLAETIFSSDEDA